MSTNDNPSPAEVNGRGNNGRFQPGNKLGRGNPMNARAQRIRAILLKALTPADARAIAAKLIEQSKGGDLAAIRELLDRTIGKPASSEVLERIETLERQMEQRR